VCEIWKIKPPVKNKKPPAEPAIKKPPVKNKKPPAEPGAKKRWDYAT